MSNRITIYDIAKETGTSAATVSRVLNKSKHPIKQEVRDRILEAADRLGYIPNLQARSLKRKNSMTIGVVIPSIDNPFYPAIVRGIEDEVVKNNYNMYVFSCDRDKARISNILDTMQAMNISGIINIFNDDLPDTIQRFTENNGLALNVVSNDLCLPGMFTIRSNKFRECTMGLEYLYDLGHKKIAIVLNEINNSIRANRLKAYENFCNAKLGGLDRNRIYIFSEENSQEPMDEAKRGYLMAKELLERTPEVTAIICMNDIMALGVIKALREAKKKVPQDYSVVGFDDLFFADSIEPTLTTVGLEQYSWGNALAKYYFELLNDPMSHAKVVEEKEILPISRLIIRNSTKKL